MRCKGFDLDLRQRQILQVERGELELTEEQVYQLSQALMVSVDYLITDRPAEWARAHEHTNVPQTSVERDTGA